MKILFLDDMEIRHKTFAKKFKGNDITFVKTAKEAIDVLSKDLEWDLICLDHDLGNRIFISSNDENSGYQVAKFLEDKNLKCEIVIHSCNPIGAKNMMRCLPQADYKPIFWL